MVNFWKQSKQSSSRLKPVKFTNWNIFPKRTAKENRLIRMKPFVDTDGDKVPNWMDCKPLNKNKQSYGYMRKEVEKEFFPNKKELSKKETIERIKNINRQAEPNINKGDYVIEKVPLRFKSASRKLTKTYREHSKGPAIIEKHAKIMGISQEQALKNLAGPVKIMKKREIIKQLAKNPELLAKARKYKISEIDVDSPEELRAGGERTFVERFKKEGKKLKTRGTERIGASYHNPSRKITISPMQLKEESTIHNLKHELQHAEQREEYDKANPDKVKSEYESWHAFARKYKSNPEYHEDDADRAGREPTEREMAREIEEKPEALQAIESYEEEYKDEVEDETKSNGGNNGR